ncbi:MAG: S41 family peptidase [Bergeyella sp.]
MKNLCLLLALIVLTSCVSVKKHNERLEKPIAPEKLRKDTDFAYAKLKKLHPELYRYTGKEKMDKKFDSLKATIQQPMKSAEFYTKLAPVIAEVREGHLRLVPPEKMLTKKEIKKLKNQKGLLGRMNYVIDSNRIFVKDNRDKFENIKVGTEILSIKGIPVKNYLDRYQNFVNSDGYNTTFQKYSMARRWTSFFTIENGILDSVEISTRYRNETKTFYIHREIQTKKEQKEEKKQIAVIKKDETKKTKDYNPALRDFNRDLQFLSADSSIAYMKIKTFSGTYSRKFYKESFAQLQKTKSKYLILDIRDNLGGSLSEIHNLYSYLSPEEFQFLKDIEVTSRTSMLHANYFSDFSTITQPIAVIGYPLYFIGTMLSTKKKDGKIYLKNNNAFTLKKPKKTVFKGEIYVLVNGSSFSASSIISSKLKNDKIALIVGEETGGANDGTVAGRYSSQKLPNSKMYLPIGLMLIQPEINFSHTQKGVIPDMEIIPSLNDVLEKKDIQLKWVMDDIEKKGKLSSRTLQ